MKSTTTYLHTKIATFLFILFFSVATAKAWKSIEIKSQDSIPIQLNISDDLILSFNESHLSLKSAYYALEIPREELIELSFNHDAIQDHTIKPEPPSVEPDPEEDPDDPENPEEPENPDDPENPENPDKGNPDEKDPDLPTIIQEIRDDSIRFDNERITMPQPSEVEIFTLSGNLVKSLSDCSEISMTSLEKGVYIIVINGKSFRIVR